MMSSCPGYCASGSPYRSGCVRCGRAQDQHPEPPAPRVMARDHDLERQMLTEAAGGLTVEAERLAEYAAIRAHDGPVRLERDLVVEACEEVADLANYLRWELQRMLEAGEDEHEKRAALWAALKLTVQVWAMVEQARRSVA